MISILDVGSGNIRSFLNTYKKAGIHPRIVTNRRELLQSKKIIIPGVGSFDSFMTKLNYSGVRETLEKQVLENQVPVLGVCVGMQIMGESSDEGEQEGLGWIKGSSLKFIPTEQLPTPAMGWNSIRTTSDFSIFKNVNLDDGFYFLHSFYFKETESLINKATSDYGNKFTCAFQKENILGVQFHPEKSHSNGLTLLTNFYEARL